MKKVIFLGLMALMFLLSCSDETLDVTISDKYVNTETDIVVIDTLSVAMSTVKLDSVPTSSSNNYMMCGSYTDDNFGDISATGYTELEIPSATPDEDEVYDSIVVRLHYSGISYGDTLQPQTIKVHEVLEDIELPDEYDVDPYLYNKTKLKYDPVPLGSVTTTPRPNRDDTLRIRLSDEIGKEFMYYLRDDYDEIDDNDDFTDRFNGLAFVPGDENNSILSFGASDSTIEVIVYTHENTFIKTENQYIFNYTSSVEHFQNIETDPTGTGLEAITEQRYGVSSGSLDDKAFLQGSTGYITRLDFPSLDRLFMLNTKNILYKVELILNVREGSYSSAETLPDELIMYSTGDRNKLEEALTDSEGSTLTSSFYYDKYYNEAYYYFDITDYIYNEISDGYIEEDAGLLVLPSATELYGTLNNVVFDARSKEIYRPKLKLYYIFYE